MKNKCKTIILKCPENFIKYNVPSGTNDNDYKDCVAVDECLQDEILYLWSKGIKTSGCCCGHGQYDGFINIFDESIDDMISLGYELWDWNKMYPDEETRPDFAINRKDTFKTKTLCQKVVE